MKILVPLLITYLISKPLPNEGSNLDSPPLEHENELNVELPDHIKAHLEKTINKFKSTTDEKLNIQKQK